jgi:PAS domain S-box-containing protein
MDILLFIEFIQSFLTIFKKLETIFVDLQEILNRTDISDEAKEVFRKKIQEQLKLLSEVSKSESLYRALVDSSRDILFTTDSEGVIESINPAAERLLGWSENDIVGRSFDFLIHPDDLELVFQGFSAILSNEVPPTPEIRILSKSGSFSLFEIKASPRIRKNDGKIVGLLGFAHSIQELRESEERYRTLIETALEGVWVTDLENKTIYINPALEQMLGYTLDEIKGRSVIDFLTKDSLPIFDQKARERYNNGVPASSYELSFVRKDGMHIIARVAGTALYEKKKIVGSFGLLTDITAEKEAQERYRALIEFNPDAIVVTDLNFNVIQVNQQALQINGAENVEDLIGLNALEFIAPEDRQYAIANATRTFEEGHAFTFEYTLLRLDGTPFPGELIVTTLKGKNGEPAAFMAIMRDITARKQAEARLIESERNYRTLVENINSGIFRVNQQGRIVQANRAFLELFGFSSFEEAAIADLANLYVNPKDRNRFIEELYREGQLNLKEVLMKTKDGILFWASISARVSPNGQWHDGIIEDISERQYANEAIKQVKLEEERYHAMLSHFLRNDLQKIVSNIEFLLLEKSQETGLSRVDVKEIIDIATRSSKTIDIVNLIFEVLQKSSIFEDEENLVETNMDSLVSDLIEEFEDSHRVFEADLIPITLVHDGYLSHAISEIFSFVIDSNDDSSAEDSRILVSQHLHDQHSCLTIRDYTSSPIPKRVCDKLATKISENWESHGFYIGITLASVILQHLNGQLKIVPYYPQGNEFQLWLPNSLIKSSDE